MVPSVLLSQQVDYNQSLLLDLIYAVVFPCFQSFLDDGEEEKIPDDFYYDAEDHISKALVSEDSGLPLDLLTIQYPFIQYSDQM